MHGMERQEWVGLEREGGRGGAGWEGSLVSRETLKGRLPGRWSGSDTLRSVPHLECISEAVHITQSTLSVWHAFHRQSPDSQLELVTASFSRQSAYILSAGTQMAVLDSAMSNVSRRSVSGCSCLHSPTSTCGTPWEGIRLIRDSFKHALQAAPAAMKRSAEARNCSRRVGTRL